MTDVPVTATGRPAQRLPLVSNLLVFAFGVLALFELAHRWGAGDATQLLPALAAPLTRYGALRAWVVAHPWLTGFGVVLLVAALAVATRAWLLVWHNELVARLSGTYFAEEPLTFPMAPVDLLAEVGRRPKGQLFVGLSPRRRWHGWRWEPVYLSPHQRSTHRQVIGKTGSGKTQSVLWPQVLQDALDGKGVVLLSAKGSDEEVAVMKGIARVAGRERELKVFSLPAWNQPQVWSHTYNLVHVQPRRGDDPGGDPVPMAERVFSVLQPQMGDNDYYNSQAQLLFTNACRLLHGMVDDRGLGLPFVIRDLAVLVKGIGGTGGWEQALDFCLMTSKDREAAEEIAGQVHRLGRDVQKTFSGLIGALDKLLSPLVNAYAPDIVFEEVVQKGQLVYVQLPANLFKLQAPALGRAILMDLQQEGGLRQVFRRTRSQVPFSVVVDEFASFADLHVIDSLNKLRDAHIDFTLAHQSPADLELVSHEFATSVWDNTRLKDVLAQDNPELCERLAKSLGTQQVVERTVRRQQGALFTSLTTGDASSKLVEAYRLHPNAIKSLGRCGQGYVYDGGTMTPIVYGMLPETLRADYPLARNDQASARGLRLYERFVRRGRP